MASMSAADREVIERAVRAVVEAAGGRCRGALVLLHLGGDEVLVGVGAPAAHADAERDWFIRSGDRVVRRWVAAELNAAGAEVI